MRACLRDSAWLPLLAPACPNCTSLLNSLAHVPLTQATTGFFIRPSLSASTCAPSKKDQAISNEPAMSADPTQRQCIVVGATAISKHHSIKIMPPAALCTGLTQKEVVGHLSVVLCLRSRKVEQRTREYSSWPPSSPSTTIILICGMFS